MWDTILDQGHSAPMAATEIRNLFAIVRFNVIIFTLEDIMPQNAQK